MPYSKPYYCEGWAAYGNGLPLSACPLRLPDTRAEWIAGWVARSLLEPRVDNAALRALDKNREEGGHDDE
jgi:ribosome modulation factor